jgi:hypothetical protein
MVEEYLYRVLGAAVKGSQLTEENLLAIMSAGVRALLGRARMIAGQSLKRMIIALVINSLVTWPVLADSQYTKANDTLERETIQCAGDSQPADIDSPEALVQSEDGDVEGTPQKQSGESEHSQTWVATEEGIKDAEADVNRGEWFVAGLLLNGVGLLAAYVTGTEPRSSRLLGKDPDYVNAYTYAYTERAQHLKRRSALAGFTISSLVCFVTVGCILGVKAMEAALDVMSEMGCGAHPVPE